MTDGYELRFRFTESRSTETPLTRIHITRHIAQELLLKLISLWKSFCVCSVCVPALCCSHTRYPSTLCGQSKNLLLIHVTSFIIVIYAEQWPNILLGIGDYVLQMRHMHAKQNKILLSSLAGRSLGDIASIALGPFGHWMPAQPAARTAPFTVINSFENVEHGNSVDAALSLSPSVSPAFLRSRSFLVLINKGDSQAHAHGLARAAILMVFIYLSCLRRERAAALRRPSACSAGQST